MRESDIEGAQYAEIRLKAFDRLRSISTEGDEELAVLVAKRLGWMASLLTDFAIEVKNGDEK